MAVIKRVTAELAGLGLREHAVLVQRHAKPRLGKRPQPDLHELRSAFRTAGWLPAGHSLRLREHAALDSIGSRSGCPVDLAALVTEGRVPRNVAVGATPDLNGCIADTVILADPGLR